MVFSPLYMQRLQPIGTPGLKGQWDGKPLWPGVEAVLAKLKEKEGMGVDFAAVQKLFMPTCNAWKASRKDAQARNPAQPITLARVLNTIDRVFIANKSSMEAKPTATISDASPYCTFDCDERSSSFTQ